MRTKKKKTPLRVLPQESKFKRITNQGKEASENQERNDTFHVIMPGIFISQLENSEKPLLTDKAMKA